MRRLLRILSATLAITLTLLALATLIAWPISYSTRGAPTVTYHACVSRPDPASGTPRAWGYEAQASTVGGELAVIRVVQWDPPDDRRPDWNVHRSTWFSRLMIYEPAPLWRPSFDPSWYRAERQAFVQRNYSVPRYGFRLTIPLWQLALLFAAWPTWLVACRVRRRIRRRREAGLHLCSNCRYDLRATPERCPECGTAVAIRLDQT